LIDRANGQPVRRRRTWYRRRLRNQRILAAFVVVAVLATAAGWQTAFRLFSRPGHGAPESSDSAFGHSRPTVSWGSFRPAKHSVYTSSIPGVYPYSVVPGGLNSADSLRRAAAGDRAVARHFADFHYDNARFVRVEQPREVYVSYRIRDTIFWTQKRIRLHIGEMLLTDGKITARAKCGNQISDTAKPEVSKEEPEEDILDQPVALEPIVPTLPVRAQLELPSGQPISSKPFTLSYSFPYVPYGLPLPPRNCQFVGELADKNCVHHKKPVTPEPSTYILFGSGLALVGWLYRRKRLLA